MASFTENRKLFKEHSDDGAYCKTSSTSVPSSEVHKLYKALLSNPELHAKVRACATPAAKHELIRQAGYIPVPQAQLKAEIAKCFTPSASGILPTADESEFLETVLHLASADASDFSVA